MLEKIKSDVKSILIPRVKATLSEKNQALFDDNIKYFEQYIHPDFDAEYLIFVTSQFGINKVNVYGFGRMRGLDYGDDTEE